MLRLYYILLLLAICFLSTSCSTEDFDIIDPKDLDPAVEAELYRYWNLYEANLETNLDSSLYYLDQMKEFAEVNGEEKWVGTAHWATGFVQDKMGYLGDAVFNFLKAAKIYKGIGELTKLANVKIHLGEIYWRAGERKTAISYYHEAVSIFEYEGNSEDRGTVLRNIGICYREMGEYAKAEEYLQKALQVVQEAKNYELISLTYNSLGAVNYKKEDFPKAINYYELAIQYADSLAGDSKLNIGMALNNIGEAYLKQGKLQQANEWLHKALAVKKEVNDPVLSQSTYNLLGELWIAKGNYTKALATVEEGLQQINLEASGTSSAVEEGFTILSKTLLSMNKEADPAQYVYLNKKFAQYSERLLTYNNRVGDIKEDLEANNRLQAVYAAAERFAYNEQVLQAEQRAARMRYLALIPIILLLGALVSFYISFRRNMHYKKLVGNIEQVLNKSKALRHLPKN